MAKSGEVMWPSGVRGTVAASERVVGVWGPKARVPSERRPGGGGRGKEWKGPETGAWCVMDGREPGAGTERVRRGGGKVTGSCKPCGSV